MPTENPTLDQPIVAKHLSLYDFFKSLGDNIQLIIPDYQRPYAWKIENVNSLLESLFESIDDTTETRVNLIGNIVLHCNKDGDFEVIDGQQRLTTLTLLCYAVATLTSEMIYNKKNKPYITDDLAYINNILYIASNDKKKRIKIQSEVNQTYKDNFYDVFEKDTIENKAEDTDENKYHINNYYRIKNYFNYPNEENTISANIPPEDILAKVINAFKSTTIILTKIYSGADALEIFNVMNSTGLPLTVENLVKTKLFSTLKEDKEYKEDKDLSDNWDEIFRETKDGKDVFWDYNDGVNTKSFFSYYFKIIYIDNIKIDKDIIEKKLQDYYLKDYLDKLDTSNIKEEFNSVIKYAKLYRLLVENNENLGADLKNIEGIDHSEEITKNISYVMFAIAQSNLWVFTPIVLYAIYKNITEVLQAIINIITLNLIANKQNSGLNKSILPMLEIIRDDTNYNDFYNKAVHKDLSTYELRQQRIVAGFKSTHNNKKARIIYMLLLLYKLDNQDNKDRSINILPINLLKQDQSLEHIYPESAKDKEINGWIALENKDLICYMGNFLVVKGKANKSLGNKSFIDKIKKYEGSENASGYAKHIPYYYIIEKISNKTIWGAEQISEMNEIYEQDFSQFFNPKT